MFDDGLSPAEDTAEGLSAAFHRVLEALPDEELMAFLRGHPELGPNAVHDAAVTPDSRGEQAGAGLGGLAAEAGARLAAVNAHWRRHFGLPFIVAVRGLDLAAILAAAAARQDGSPAAERAAAMREVGRVLRFRIEDRLGAAA